MHVNFYQARVAPRSRVLLNHTLTIKIPYIQPILIDPRVSLEKWLYTNQDLLQNKCHVLVV